jgi:hypothetical protein
MTQPRLYQCAGCPTTCVSRGHPTGWIATGVTVRGTTAYWCPSCHQLGKPEGAATTALAAQTQHLRHAGTAAGDYEIRCGDVNGRCDAPSPAAAFQRLRRPQHRLARLLRYRLRVADDWTPWFYQDVRAFVDVAASEPRDDR